MNPNKGVCSLISSATREVAAMPNPLSVANSRTGAPRRWKMRLNGASSSSPTTLAEMKLNRNSGPIVGTTE
jgi:hypothetical protein